MKTLCVSLETAKKLKAAGWKKWTVFSYTVDGRMVPSMEPEQYEWSLKEGGVFPMPQAEEVLRELPSKIDRHALTVNSGKNVWYISYESVFDLGFILPCSDFQDKSLSEAAAQMWLWLVSEGYIKMEAKP